MDVPIVLALFSRHDELLERMASLFRRLPDFAVVIATPDQRSLLRSVAELKPHVALIDQFRIPDLDSFCEALQQASADTKLAILSSGISQLLQPLPAGDHITIEKPLRGDELVNQLRMLVSK